MSSNRPPTVFFPGLEPEDALGRHWLRQVTLRLRREIAWLRWERLGDVAAPGADGLPQPVDPTQESLDLARYWLDKQKFFSSDVTAKFLSDEIQRPAPQSDETARGSFAWVVEELQLSECARFLLALGLYAPFDSAAGPVIAACQNDMSKTLPTLGLAQRLWDHPADVLEIADPHHPLFATGLIQARTDYDRGLPLWDAPLLVPGPAVRRLLRLDRGSEDGMERLGPPASTNRRTERTGLQIVPVVAPARADCGKEIAKAAEREGRSVIRLRLDPRNATSRVLSGYATFAWLDDSDLFVDLRGAPADGPHGPGLSLPLETIPVDLYVAADPEVLRRVSARLKGATLSITVPPYEARLEKWRASLAGGPVPELADAAPNLARRFRFPNGVVERVVRRLRSGDDESSLIAMGYEEVALDFGVLAERVRPRFALPELVLPKSQRGTIDEIAVAMTNLGIVHHGWGTANAWDEAGVSVLFGGPPGTGKTMAAECLSKHLELPMYRIDLSQVVNKYIGETEKNLKRVFDAAEGADVILFFDEADALFSKRTEVKSAHDRYANLEVNYLLTRMERSRGNLTILATNRRDDIDEAFLRRLRYVVDFPLPGPSERARIWESSVPPGVDVSEVNFAFLAKRFELSGGNIRSALFNACLQSASSTGAEKRLSMEQVVIAVRRELDKAGRAVSLEQFGRYAPAIERLGLGR